MIGEESASGRPHLFGMRPGDLVDALAARGVACSIAEARRVCAHVISLGHTDLRTLKRAVRRELEQAIDAQLDRAPLEMVERVRDDDDGFVKYLFRHPDGALTEGQTEQKVLWGEEHTDFNLLTLLPGGRFHDPDGKVAPAPDAGSGLYLRTRPTAEHPEGRMVRGTAPAGCIVAQVGQQLEILSGGAFLATPHVITAPHTPGWSRFSAAHFVHLNAHEMVFPLESLRTDENIRAYSPPVLAGTYAIKTLVDIGLAPPSALSKLGYRHYDRLATIRARTGDTPQP